ncbi:MULTISPECIES: MobF family relaxase [unclassified Streptomyces]|uniref:MobF family relaxase n=1 Tax=unclassified Streptomyces TaxID=2593676 RepID=UPI003322E4FA
MGGVVELVGARPPPGPHAAARRPGAGRGRYPYADRIEAERLAAGDSPKKAYRAGALGRRVTVTGVEFVFRPQPTIYLLWALGDEKTRRRMIEAAHEYAIERVLEWIEDEVAVIRYGKDGIYRVRPPGGLVAARFRHYEARSGWPLLHDHLLLSVKGQRLDGKWGSIHTMALHENTVAASALYNELVASEVCEALGLATEPRTVTPGRRPVMEISGVPHELIRWTARRSDQIAACMEDLQHEYVTAVDDGEPRSLPVVSERARAKMNQIAARKSCPPKRKTQPLAQLRAWWKVSAILTSKVAADVINSLLEHARAAAAAIRARVAAVADVALAAVDVTATVFVMNEGGRFHCRHLLAEARRHLALVLRGRRRDPGLDEEIVAAAISTHCLDISEPKATIGLLADYRLYTARWDLADLPARRRPPAPAPDPDRQPPAEPGELAALRPPGQDAGGGGGERERSRASRSSTTVPSSPAWWYGRSCAPPRPPPCGAGRMTSSPISRRRCPSSCARPRPPKPSTTTRGRSRQEAIDMTAVRALRESRTDVEALHLTADRLRRLQEAATKMADESRVRADRHTAQADTDVVRPVRPDDQQAHRPQEPGPHRGREAGH